MSIAPRDMTDEQLATAVEVFAVAHPGVGPYLREAAVRIRAASVEMRAAREAREARAHQRREHRPRWLDRVAYWGWRCRYCGISLTPRSLTFDHQIPQALGGLEVPANIVPCCRPCNSAKRDKMPSEFAGRRA